MFSMDKILLPVDFSSAAFQPRATRCQPSRDISERRLPCCMS